MFHFANISTNEGSPEVSATHAKSLVVAATAHWHAKAGNPAWASKPSQAVPVVELRAHRPVHALAAVESRNGHISFHGRTAICLWYVVLIWKGLLFS